MLKSRIKKIMLRCFAKNTGGASAVEFSLIAPVLIFGALLMVDVGMALGERMELDHIVRSGAESAMIKHDEEKVLMVMQSSAAQSFTTTQTDTETQSAQPVLLSANRYCACGEATSSCDVACATDQPPNVFFDIGAKKTYSGLLLPDLNFNAKMLVQLR
jgi:pilus assembly protein CpaE